MYTLNTLDVLIICIGQMAQGIWTPTSGKNVIILINVFIEMDVVKSHDADVKNNYEGTTERPLYVNKIPGK